jgi:hypothetical protein
MPDEPLWCLVIPSNSEFHRSVPLDLLRAPAGDGLGEFVNDLVGGHFQVVRAPAGASMYLHDEGKFIGLRENVVATALAHDAGLSLGDWVVGQVVMFGLPDHDGWDTSVPDELLALLERRGCHIAGRQAPSEQ